MNEEQVIKKIESDYFKQFSVDYATQTLPRHVPIDQFDKLQMTYLVEMMNVENNLHLDIILKNISKNETFKFEDFDLEKITHAPSKFSIESIQFNLASAIIFIGLYYQEDVQDLMKAYSPDAKINTLYLSLAAMIILICLYLIFAIKDQYGKTPILIVFAVGFSAMAYIYESLKSFMPKQKKLKELEYQYLVAEYLGLQLEQTACKFLPLDFVEFEN